MKNPFSFLNEFWKHGVGAIVILIVLAYAVNLFANYLSNKSSSGSEKFGESPKKAYGNSKNDLNNNHLDQFQHKKVATNPIHL
jgi:hypothetical protein